MVDESRARLKLQTPVDFEACSGLLSYGKPMLMLGSCFADNIGRRLEERGFPVLVNPMGTLYNPVSIANTLERIEEGRQFEEGDCTTIGAGDGRVCTFFHHTSRARENVGTFLADANRELETAREHWKKSETLVVTLGTAWCFHNIERQYVVSNCLKHHPKEFDRRLLAIGESVSQIERVMKIAGNRQVVFTVSPIRHMADGAHGNAVSKSTLLLSAEDIVRRYQNAKYFPSYEIMNDELRDYRFYAEDMTHPSQQAEQYIFDRFIDYALAEGERERLTEETKKMKQRSHINKALR
ncbi:MAG: GSCFA domain-containing protein [Bacteroidales bacterium]|nr:GSCFA domain-containing protein [Bacteroidales bacterium]